MFLSFIPLLSKLRSEVMMTSITQDMWTFCILSFGAVIVFYLKNNKIVYILFSAFMETSKYLDQ